MVYTLEEIKKIVKTTGGVHEVSVRTGMRAGSIYRILQGVNKPSYDTLMKLEKLEEEE